MVAESLLVVVRGVLDPGKADGGRAVGDDSSASRICWQHKDRLGLLTSLGYDETKQELLKRIVDEDCNIIGRAVQAGEQPEGEIPPSLDYTPAYAYASEEAQRAAKRRRLNSGEEEEEEEEEDAHFRYQIGGTMVMIDPFGRTAGSRSFD